MVTFFSENDPYGHPILIHSHATAHHKDEILTPLLNSDYNGISFQVDLRQQVFSEIVKWRNLSKQANQGAPWLISMDEIGKWWTGAKIDSDDPTHDSLRQHVLWPTFLANGAGVEWYAGGRQAHNDLGLEDYRARESLYKQSAIAHEFIRKHVPIWDLSPVFYPEDGSVIIDGLEDKPHTEMPAASVYAAKNTHYFLAYNAKSVIKNLSEMPSY